MTAYPRSLGRTARNMLTFRDRRAALEEWVIVGAWLADARTTQSGLNRCTTCQETFFAFGKRPGAPRIYSESAAFALSFAALQQAAHETFDADGPHWPLYITPASQGLVHGLAAYRNSTIPRSPAVPAQ